MKRFKYLVLTLCFTLSWPAFAAPLFPDVPDNHWAKDAVAALAAKGLVEGYPDGTFKGDRSASRWETAMIVARLLAKMEQAHATFATKAELDELRKLVDALREELDALGVRVDNLEEAVGLLDRRVTELERISFYGFVDSRVAFQSFRNTGRPSMRSLNPGIQYDTINYNAWAGTAASAGGFLAPFTGIGTGPDLPPGQTTIVPTGNPFTTGILGTTNWRTGRPLTSGTGFTARAILGLDIKVTDDIDAGVEFSAYSSAGDQIVDAYYGVQQPYLSNPFTASSINAAGAAQGLNHVPYTRMNLDRFWVRHNPSGTKLILGTYDEQDFNDAVFGGMFNPNEFGPEHLPNYGFLVDGRFAVDQNEEAFVSWQVMGTLLPDGSSGALPIPNNTIPGVGVGYQSYAFGTKIGIDWDEERGKASFNFLRATDEATNGQALTVGLLQNPNLNQLLNWVNPPGFYIQELNDFPSARAGIGSTSDNRPIPMNPFPLFNNDGSLANAVNAGLLPQGVPNVGGIGPQSQNTWGFAVEYTFDHKWSPKVYGEWATSSYRPNKNSIYTADGDAWRVGANMLLLDGNLDLEGEYLSVDPRFSPFIIQVPIVGGITTPLWHTPDFHYYNNLYSLHNTKELPHNREGFRLKGTWKFLPTGRVIVEYGNLDQKTASVQDVRFSTGSLGTFNTPNTPVLGFSPGWIEPLFGGLHPASFGASGGNSLAVPLETNKGTVENLYISGGYKWLMDEENNNRGLTLSGGVKILNFDRKSNMQAIGASRGIPGAGTQAENQNLVDLGFVGWHVQADYDVTEKFMVFGGFTKVDIKGHLDPLNINGLYAESVGTANFNNIDITQTWPELGFEWDIAEDLTWGATGRYFSFTDNIPEHVFNTPQLPALNINNGPQVAHPFNWEGIQITSQFSLKF